MKIRITIIIYSILSAALLLAQAPQHFKYIAVARDDVGNILVNQDIGLRISIVDGGVDGTEDYIETHQLKSNQSGVIEIIIGAGTVEKGALDKVNWEQGSFHIKIEMDSRGGNDYKVAGTSQLLPVPYTLYAEKAGVVLDQNGIPVNTDGSGNNNGNRNGEPNTIFPPDDNSHLNLNAGKVGVGTSLPEAKLDVVGRVQASEGYIADSDTGLFFAGQHISGVNFDNSSYTYTGMRSGRGILTVLCEGPLYDARDGQYYNIVQIGDQCWMAENLNIGIRIDGDLMQTDNDTIEKYCYDNIESNCDIYGGLYQWDEMMQYGSRSLQGICPEGWHLASDEEWCELENEVDIGTVDCFAGNWRGTDVGGNLKETGLDHWLTPNKGATNASGFSARGAGYRRDPYGTFMAITVQAFYWTSLETTNGLNAWNRQLYYNGKQIARGGWAKGYGNSVRCIRD